MQATITDAEESAIISKVVREIMTNHGDRLKLLTPTQVCGLLDITPKMLPSLGLNKVDVCGNGRTVRYRMDDVDRVITERTIKAFKTASRRRQSKPKAGDP